MLGAAEIYVTGDSGPGGKEWDTNKKHRALFKFPYERNDD